MADGDVPSVASLNKAERFVRAPWATEDIVLDVTLDQLDAPPETHYPDLVPSEGGSGEAMTEWSFMQSVQVSSVLEQSIKQI